MTLVLFALLTLGAQAGTLYGRANLSEIPSEAPFTLEIHSLERGEGAELRFSATRDGTHTFEGMATLETGTSGESRALLEEREIPARGTCSSPTRVRTLLVFNSEGALSHPELLLTREPDPCQAERTERTVRLKKLEPLPQDSIWLSSLPLAPLKLEFQESPGVAELPDLLSIQLFWEPVARMPLETRAEQIGQTCAQTVSVSAGKLTARIWDEINSTHGATREWPLALEQTVHATLSNEAECNAWSAQEWREKMATTLRLELAASARTLALPLGGFLLELDFYPLERTLPVSL